MKNLFFTIILTIFLTTSALSQIINIIDNTTNFPVAFVNVYSDSYPDTLYSDEEGTVDLSLFYDDDVIYLDHEFYKLAFYTKTELARKNVVKLTQGDFLKEENKSPLAVEEYSKDLPFYVDIIDLKENSVFQNNTDETAISQKVMYEKNQDGGNSAFRGLEANKVLLVLDGIRLDNIIYRYGRIQNSINFENTVLERTQQIFGPNFLTYSSDASGGVINYFTKQPIFANEEEMFKHKLNLTNQYSSATQTWISNINLNIGFKKVATFTSITYNDYGMVQVGKNRNNLVSENYGLHKYYVETIDNKDTMLQNPNPTKLMNTNYKRYSIVNKLNFKIAQNINIISNFQYTKNFTNDIYSGLTEVNGDHNRFAVCEYRPTENVLFSLNAIFKQQTKFYTYFSILPSFQRIEEYRVTRKFKSIKELHQIENLNVYSLNLDFIKLVSIHRLMYGFEISQNNLQSDAYLRDIKTDSTSLGLNRYPTNGTVSNNYAGYINFKWLIHPQFILNSGLRYEFTNSESQFSTDLPQLKLDFTEVKYNKNFPSGSLSIETYPFIGMQITLTGSTAFHVPIVDEYGKVMTKDFVVTIPNNKLKPEKTYNVELTLNQKILEYLTFNVTGFNTWLKDALVLSDYQLNGSDSLYFGADRYKIATTINLNMAQIYGVSSSLSYSIYFLDSEKKYLKFKSSINYIVGKNLEENIPLPNISPVFGQASCVFSWEKFNISFSHIYNGLKKYEDLSPIGQDYIEKADINGFMAWQTLNFSVSYSFFNKISTQFAISNILDSFYRSYASSVSAPGRNFVFTLKINL